MSDQDDATKHDKPVRASQEKVKAGPPDFGPRYRVIGTLGKGGMGEVFRAYDTELKGEVALKVIRGDADHAGALARFRREIALARKVTSPHVLRVYDLAEHDGLHFLSMEYVDGQDLDALMRRDGRMPIEAAVEIFRQVCEGLVAAHAEGVVHRDLKPQNVLVDTEGRVRVGDFGLARSIGDSGLTASGSIVGSPAYMSPEQVKGDSTDERSDIYALGIILYQLITGELPFTGSSPHAIMEMRLHKRPELLRDVRPDAPARLEALCAKCLALTPSARYASVAEVLAVLDATGAPPPARRPRWMVPAIAGGVIAAAGVTLAIVAWPRGTEAPTTPPSAGSAVSLVGYEGARVVVLGVQNRTDDPLFDGTLDIVLESALRRSTRIDPIAGTELRTLAAELGPKVGLDDELGKKLAARDAVRVIALRGSIAAKGAVFTLELVATDAVTGARVAGKTVETSREGVVAALGVFARELREAVGEPVSGADREQTGLSPVLEADHEYAIGYAAGRAGDTAGAIEHFRAAIEKDLRFAKAHAQLATAYSNASREADSNAETKLALQYVDQLGERDRLKFLAMYYRVTTEDYDRAIAAYDQLLAKWPLDFPGQSGLSIAYQLKGDIPKAIEAAARGVHDHPRNVTARSNFAEFEVMGGRFDQAIADLKQILASFSRPPEPTWEYLALAHMLSGNRADALAAYDSYTKADPSGGATAKADHALAEGRLRDAVEILEKGIAADAADKLVDAVEIKSGMLAEAKLRRGDKAGARAAAARVTKQPQRQLVAALVLLAAGDESRALATAKTLGEDIAPSHRAIAKLIEAEVARAKGKPQVAMLAAQDAIKLADLPSAHFLLARAALDAKRFAEAYTELQTCIARRGEAAIAADDVPSLRNVPPFTYYLAKAQEGLGSPEAKASYAAFLAMLHDPDPGDPMVADARKHAP